MVMWKYRCWETITIKRTRKRQIEKARMMAMSPRQRKQYKAMMSLAKAFTQAGKAAKKACDSVEHQLQEQLRRVCR